KTHLKGENLINIDFANVAADTERYSDSDLKSKSNIIETARQLGTQLFLDLCVSAALEALKDCVGGFELPLTNSQTEENKESWPEVSRDSDGETPVTNSPQLLAERTITMEHIKWAFRHVAASFSFEGNKELYAWHKVYGTRTEGDASRM
ncbi:hypothetical protein L218DRAFT_1050273, partial [Marasmius fiardii PR-910]